ncbi:MAG: HAD family phosphatase [Acidobacteriota bacterium]
MLKAIIFDCDGIIANTEPLHFAALTRTLAEEGIEITESEYYDEYLAFDDKGCFKMAFNKSNRPLTEEKIKQLISRKAAYFEPNLKKNLQLFPGVLSFIHLTSSKYPLAIASGARRDEILAILNFANLTEFFNGIVSTEDVVKGKPDPESFLKALSILQSQGNSSLNSENCLVIEDSIKGIKAARAAGMLCVAVTNSYKRDELSHADLIVDSLADLTLSEVESLFLKS